MASLNLFLFGNPRLERDQRSLKVRRRKSVALLAYLAVTGRPHNRDALATMLWPEHDQSGARANLRRELSRLKRVVGDEILEADRTQARINPEGGLWSDVAAFRDYLKQAEEHDRNDGRLCETCVEALAQGVALYRDDFMAGFTLPDCPEFDEWQFFEGEGLRQSLGGTLQLLIDWHVSRETFEQAIEYGRRWLSLDTLHEPAHRQMMKLYAWTGQQAAAVRQYEECVRLLEEELGVEPDPETTSLYEMIHARQLPSPETIEKGAQVTTLPPEEQYVADEQLAVGGQGEVFRGRDRITDEPVIIKRIRGELVSDPEQVARFVREGEALRQLNHPNIVRMLDAFEHEGQHCIVMEYVPGGSLRDLLDAEQSMPVDQALEIALELADALSRAHHLGIVHRDLKPENVLLAADGTPRLTDFGVARLERDDSHLTRTGAFVGSPAYMSPEALRGEALDARSDIWSFGILLFEMLTGRRPFDGERVTQVLVSILNDPAPSLSYFRTDAPLPLVALVRRMLVKNREARIHSMRLVAAGLEAIRDDRMDSWLGEQVAAAMAQETPPPPPTTTPAPITPVPSPTAPADQQIHFCTTQDDVRIAYATVGQGPHFVKAANWLSHLEFDWESPVWRHWLGALSRHHTLVRYDERGCGLSDWDVETLSVEAFVQDLEAVVDEAGLDRFPLLGISQGGPIAMTYAVRHPERVSHLILYGTYAAGRFNRIYSSEQAETARAILQLIELGWGKNNPAFRQFFTSLFMPEATAEQMRWFNDLQRVSTSPEMARRLENTFFQIDVRDVVPRLAVPTLILHGRDDAVVPFEEGRQLAAAIPNARFVPLDSKNHILLEEEPAWQRFVTEVYRFVGVDAPGLPPLPDNGDRQSVLASHYTPAADLSPPSMPPVFVGRDQEMDHLRATLRAAISGRSQIAFVTGEAGQGKTTLLQAFARKAQKEHPELIVAGGQGNAYTGVGDPYVPFREILELLTGDVEARAASRALPPDHTRRLRAMLPTTVKAIVEAGPDLIDVFISGRTLLERASAVTPAGTPWLERFRSLISSREQRPGTGNVQQSALFEQYARVIQTLSQRWPLLLLLDDLQWVDQPSTNLLFHLGRRLSGSRVLIVGAYRPAEVALDRQGERHPLEGVVHEFQRQFGDITIDLSKTEGRAFVNALLDVEPNRLDTSFRDTLYRQTGGQPLFTSELLRGMQERGDLKQDETGHWIEQPGLDWQTLPARVEGAIGERIGRLDASLKELLQVASVEGEEFTAEVLARVLDTDPREVTRRLSRELEKGHRLVQALGVRREGTLRLSRYRFQHILIQRYLYDNLDPVEKRLFHEAIARQVEGLHGEQSEDVAVELAWHFERAEMDEKVVPYLQQAAEQALRRSAHRPAVQHLNKGLKILQALPETPERSGQELMLLTMLGPALIAIKGWADPDVEEVYVRAHALSTRMGRPPQLGPVLYGLASLREYRGEYEDAEALLEERLQLPEAGEDPALRLESHELLACSTFHQGAFSRTLEHAQQGLSIYDPQQHRDLLPLHGKNLEIFCHVWAAHSLWFLGYPDQAHERIQRALRVAGQLEHTFSLVSVQVQAAFLYQFARDTERAQELAEEAIRLATENEYVYRVAEGEIVLGWALAAAGDPGTGLVKLNSGLAEYQAMGSRVDLPYFLALKAEVLSYAGRIEEGLDAIEEALAAIPGNRAFFYEAELHRLRGALRLQKDEAQNAESAEASFARALEVARNQQTKMLELRAAVSLSDLWQKQGRGADAHSLLSSVYGWFTEGGASGDLQEAAALLARMESDGTPSEERFVAREEEMARLTSWLEAALAGRHRVVFATGEAGQGKTTLLKAFSAAAQEQNEALVIASGSGNAYTGTGDPYLPFREILERLTGDVDLNTPSGIRRPEYVRRLRSLVPVAAEALVEHGPDLIDTFIAGRHLLQRAANAAPSGAPWLNRLEEIVQHNTSGESTARLQQAALFEQYARVIQSVSKRHPLLLLLDDLQWADAGSAALLLHLGRRLSGSRVLILGAYRPAAVAQGRHGERHPLAQVIPELQRDFGKITLDLNRAEGRFFVESLIDSEPNRLPDSFRETLYRQTGGHPLFTIELLRSMRERGDVTKDEDGYWVARPDLDWQTLPARVEGVIGERVGRLDRSLRDLLRVASVEGKEFSAEVVAHVLGQDRRKVARRLGRELEGRHHIIEALGVSQEDSVRLSRYRFRHILIQHYLYMGLDEVERAYQHEAVGEALETLYGDQATAVAVQLARHFDAAGNREKAAVYLRHAGDQAWNAAALEEAARYFSDALDQWPAKDKAGRAELQRLLGESQWVSGHTEDALESFQAACDLFEAVNDRKGLGAVYRLIGRLYWEQGNREQSLEKYHAALELLQEGPETVELAWAISSISQMHMLASEYEAAVEWGERALELARKLEAFDVMAHALNNVGSARLWTGDPGRGEEMLRESLRLALELRMPHDACRALLNLGEGLETFGSEEDARSVLTELLDYATSVHTPLFAGSALVELARLDWHRGNWAAALARQPEIEQWIEQGQSLRYVVVIHSTLFGHIYNDLGAAALAREMLEERLARARRMSELQTTAPHLGEMVRALTLLGEEEEAAALADEYLRLTKDGTYFLHWNISRLLYMCRWLAGRSDMERLRWSTERLEDALTQFGSMEAEAAVYESRGILALAENERPGKAAEHFRRAAHWWQELGRPLDRARVLNDLGRALLQAGEPDEAQEVLELATDLIEALSAQLDDAELRGSFLESPLVGEIQEARRQRHTSS